MAKKNEQYDSHVQNMIKVGSPRKSKKKKGKNEIVSVGTNKFRTHPLAKKYGYRFDEVHSELDALLRYRGPKDNLKLVNYRFNRFGDMRISKPCCNCLLWCLALFDDIWYSTNNGIKHIGD